MNVRVDEETDIMVKQHIEKKRNNKIQIFDHR